MPLDKGKLQKLYSTLQQGGYSQSYDEFEKGFTGNDNYPNRKKVYDLLTEHGADIGNSYEDFMGKMQAPSQPSQPQQQKTPAPAPAPKPQPKPAPKPKPRPQPKPKGGGMTAAERAQFIRNAQGIVHHSAAGLQRVKNQMDYANGNRGLKVRPVHLGQNSKVVRRHANGNVAKQRPVFDVAPEQQPGDTYLTESGNEFTSRAEADTEQNAVDQYRYDQSETGQLNNAYAEADRLDKLLEQRGKELDAENQDKWWRDLPRGGGGAVSTMNANDNNGRMTDTEYLNLLAARKKVDEQIRDLKAARDEKTGTFLGGLWRGFRDYAFDPSNWDNGYRDLLTTSAMLRAKTGAAQTPREKASERMMMEDTYKAGEAAQKAEKVLGNGYRFMRIGAQSLPFALQFMAGNATGMISGLKRAGEGMGVKLARKIAIKQGANNMLRNIGRSVLKNTGVALGDLGAATALTNTVQAAQTWADIGHRYAGDVTYDPKTGDYKLEGGKSLGRSIYEGEANSIIENYTEMLGEHMHLGKFASSALTKMGLGRVSNWFTKVGKTDFMQGVNKYMKMAGFNGYPQEVMEEEVGIPLHAVFDGGNKMSDLLDGRQQLDIVGGMLFSMAGMGGASMAMQGGHKAAMAVQYHQDQHKLDNADKVASFRLTADKWAPIKEEIDGTTNEEFGKVMKDVLSNDELSDQEKQAVWDYAQRLIIMRGHNMGQEAATRNGMTDKETNTANESYTQGYNTTDPAAMNDAKNRLAAAQQKLDGIFGENTNAQQILDAKKEDGSPYFTANDRKAAQAVVNAQQEYEGMMQRVRDDIDDEVQQTGAIYDSRTNDNGVIQSATLKAQNPDGTDKKVYITSGNVVMTDDGKSVDKQKSDMSIVVVDEDGKVQMISPDELFSLDTPIDGAQAKQQAIDAIQQSKAQEAADKINGKVNLTAGNTYTLTDNTGQQIEATIVADGQTGAVQNPDGTVNVSMNGKVVAMDVNTLQQMVDNTNMQKAEQGLDPRLVSRGTEQGAEDSEGQEQPTEQEGDQGILDQGGTVVPDDEGSGAVPTYPGSVITPDVQEPHQWQVDDTFTIDNGGMPVRGQMRASDNESGGIERIDPVTTSQKLGGKVSSFANVLLSSPDEDASLSDVLMQNGAKAVKWLQSQGAISDTAAQSAFDKKGNLTPEARMDLQNILKQSLFQGGVSDLSTMFDKMPAKAQKAILSTFMRDFDSAESERILPEIQKAIEAWYDCAMSNEAFAKASNYKGAKNAMHDFERQTNLLDDNMPSDKFSNFAMELACRLQGCSMRETQQGLNDFFDLVQGKSQGDLFGGTTMGEQADRQEAIRRIFNIEYKPISNNNGKTRSNAVADNGSQSGEGRQGSPTDGKGRERAESGSGSANGAGGTESHDEEGIDKDAAAMRQPTQPNASTERTEQKQNNGKTEKPKKANAGQFGLVSDERMEELKKRLRAKLNNLNMGVDPEVLAIGLELTAGYIDRGVKKFADYSKAMINDLGDVVRPYLKAFYNGVRDMPEITSNGLDAEMDDYETVSKFNVATIGKEGEDTKPSILDTAEQVSNESHVERQAEKQMEMHQVDVMGLMADLSRGRTTSLNEHFTDNDADADIKAAHDNMMKQLDGLYRKDGRKAIEGIINTRDHVIDFYKGKLDKGETQGEAYGSHFHVDYARSLARAIGEREAAQEFMDNGFKGGAAAEQRPTEPSNDSSDSGNSGNSLAEAAKETGHLVVGGVPKSEKKEQTRYSERGFTLRPATEEDVDSNKAIYVNGKRTHIVMVVRKGEQVGAAQFSQPVIEAVYTTDNERVPLSKIEVEDLPTTVHLKTAGDFYEAYGNDAVALGEVTGVSVVTRKDGTRMAGFPKKMLDEYEQGLRNNGWDVSVDGKATKKATEKIFQQLQSAPKARTSTNAIKNALRGKKTSSKENNEKKKAVSSQQEPSLFDDLFGGEDAAAKQQHTEQNEKPRLVSRGTERDATEQTSGQGTTEQKPAVITTDDEKGKEKPIETKPEKELTGDSKEYQERAKAEQEFVERIKGMITEAAKDGRSLTMSDIKRAYNDELDGNWELPNDYKDTDLQELVERAMTLATREVALVHIRKHTPEALREGYDMIVKLYNAQPSLNARDSSRVAHQQYSTPTPFGYVMDMFMMGGDKKPLKLLEPSAGNGALTIGIPAPLWHVNDIDERRLMNLRTMPYGKITNQDGTMPFEPKAYDAVATNPPFGSTQEKEFDGGRTKISSLEGLMAINALASMKDDGRAAIIIGGNTQYMTNGAMQAKDMKLFKHLYTHYNVVDVINLDGDMYKRNGTGYNVRMILIAGRKTDVSDNPEKFTFPPVKKKARAEQVKTFDELYKRVEDDIQQAKQVEREPSATVNSDGSHTVNSASERTGNSEAASGVLQRPVRAGEMERRTQSGRTVRPSSAQDGRGNGERGQHGSADRLDNADQRNAGSNHAVQGNRPTQGQSAERREGGSTGRGTVGGDNRGGTSERNNTDGERPAVEKDAAAMQQPTQPATPKQQPEPRKPREKVALGQEKVAYPAKSQSMTLQSRVPAAQAEAIAENLDKLGDVDEMVRSELGYSSKDELYSHLAAEQIDSVALAINQMKQGKGFIIGDMTGVGKGRQGAALIRWAIKQGKTPIYFTQKARLYTDNYRDMCDIGSKGLHPFLIASNDDGNIVENVVDENGEKVYDKNGEPVTRVVYGLPKPKERERVYDYILQNGKLPPEYDYVLVTYSQIQSGTKTYEIGKNGEIEVKDKKYKGKTPGADKNGDIRRDVLEKLAKDNYVFLDESHTVGGQSSSGLYMQDMLKGAEGVTYLSATFAKRPDNMPLYAMKTAMSESGLSQKDMIDAIQKGGVTLQEIMSKQLVQSGQMIRRERDFSGVSIDWEGVDEETDKQQRAQFDEVAKIFNAIREFQDNYVDPSIEKMSEDMAEEGKFSKKTQGTSHMGVNNVPFASKMYNLVNQLLFSLKANAVADKAIECLKKGEKPVISFNNTMEGFLDDMPRNTPMKELPNFSLTLMRALEGTLRYTEGEVGNKDNQVNKTLNINDLGDEAVAKYNEIRKTILNLSIGLPIDPMDAIKMRIEAAGYKVGEITGRKSEMVKDADGNYIVQSRSSKEMDGKAAASAFNSASGKNGGLDVLLINKSGSTGISLHASSKFTDQSPRVMIAAQFQSDINDEVQMRGRIDRTGQVHRGRYIYLVSSIPAEQRLQMMFKNKLKSLDANTTSSQKSKFNEMEVTDFMNKYGDEVTWSYMMEHPDLEERLGDPLDMLSDESKKDNRRGGDEDSNPSNGYAGKILRRLPFLSVKEQEQIFNDLAEAYKVKMQILNDAGENDLEITTMPLRAETKSRKVWKEGSDPGSDNAFADNTYIETAEVDVLKKPMKAKEVREYADRLTDGKPWEQWHQEQHEAVEQFYAGKAKAVEDKAKSEAQKRIDKAREDYIKGCLKARKKGDNNWSDEEISHMADIAAKEAADKEQTKINNRYISIDAQRNDVLGALDAFTPLEPLIIPLNLKDTSTTIIPSLGTFLGIKFGKGYSRSSSTAVFATLDGRRKIEVPLSDKISLENIKHQSVMLGYQARGLNMDNWDSKVPTKSRKTAYIVTGNLMQALVDTQKSPETKGQLISYTTIDGDVKQGILMNDRFKEENLKTSVPISSMLQKLMEGEAVESTDKEVKIERGVSYHYDDFKLSVPKSKSRGGKYFLDKKLLRLLEDEFTTSGSNMTAWVSQQNLKKVLDYLSKALGVTVQVKANLKESEDSPHNDEPTTAAEEGNTRRREGRGAYSDEELSLINDPVAKWLGKSNRTKAQQKAFANRERKSMESTVKKLAKTLHLYNLNIVTDTSTLKGRKARAKGFYDRNTNEITIVIPNHRDVDDVMQTLLHEGVAHYGLRKMFGSHFDTFLDNVYAAADNDVRRRITELALSKYGGDFRVATEEYLASLAEQTDFEHIAETFWQKIKDFFLDMLHAIGFADFADKYDFTLSDNELRYILWRSYENLKEPGRYRSILGEAEDVAKQAELKVGNYSEDRQDRPSEAADSREDAIKRLTPRLVNTFKSWAKARNAFDEAFEKDPEGRLTFELGDELNKWNDLMDAAKDAAFDYGIDLGELLRDNGISGDDLEKYDDMFGGRAAGEPQAWGKRDMLSRAEQVSHGIDPDLLFRDTIEDDDNTARETYNRMADEAKSRLREAWQDSMINVRNLQQAVLEQRGEKLEDYEDAYNAENRSHGKSRAESEYFTDNLYKPLLKAVDDVAKAAKVSVGDVTEYMMAKHGLERNIVFARRDADAAYKKAYDEAKGKYDALMNASRAESDPKKADALEKAANKVKFPDYDDIFNYLRMRDYAGLTSLTGQSDVQDAEAEAQRIVNDMESKALAAAQQRPTGPSNLIDELWKATNAATKWTLKKGYESGIISKDNYNYVSGMFNYYVPLRGWQEDTAGDLFDYVGSGDKGTAFSPTLHKAKGRRSEADNPIAYIGNMAVSAIVQGNKNKVKQTFLGFVENHPTNLVTVSEMWYRNFGTDTDPDWREDVPNIPEDATADEVADIVKQHEDMMEQLKELGKATKKRGRLHLGVPVKRGQALEHHVEVMVNGKKYVLYINGNPRAAQALNGTRQRRASEHSFESSKIAQMGRLLAERYTSLSPSFTVSNALRDLTMAAITTLIKESPAYALRFRLNVLKLGGPARMFTLMKWYKKAAAQQQPTGQMSEIEKYFYEFMTEGAETGFTSLKEIDEYKKDMDKMYRNMNQKLLNPKRLFRGLSQGLEYANRCIEDMTRFAIYMASRQSGRNVKRSVSDAKNVTLNFNRKGSGEMGNSTYRNLQIFVNPAIQSLQNVGKMAKDHPVRFTLLTGSIALIGAAQVFATQLLWSVFGGGDGDDDDWNAVDEYWKLPSWQRRNNLVMWIPGTKKFAMIPLAQEFRVFHGFGETMTTVMEGKSGENPALEVLTQASDLLPLDFAGNNGNPLVNLAPTVTQPLLQVGFNTDFTGRPLYKDNDFNKYEPSFQKAYIGTPSWLIKSSEFINDITGGDDHMQGWWERTKVGKELNNPAVVDHILKGYYGGMYSFLAQLGGTMYTLGTGNMPDAQEVPVVNRVITAPRETEQGGKQKLPDWYYDLSEENARQQNEFSGYKKDYMKGDAAGQKKFNELINSKDFHKWQKVNTYIGAVQQIRTAMNYTKDPKEKAELEKSLAEVLGELKKMKDE